MLDVYFAHRCDCVVVERNRGGDAVVANLRAIGRERGVSVSVVPPDARTKHEARMMYVKETLARNAKDLRAEPVASMYERGRVSHVRGVMLEDLESMMTTWDPTTTSRSPDEIDALVHGIYELASLARSQPKERVDPFAGLQALQGKLKTFGGQGI